MRATLTLAVLVALGAPLRAAAQGSEPKISVDHSGGVYTVAAEFDIARPAQSALAVLTDYENIPNFMPGVRTSRVLQRAEGRALVEQEAVSRVLLFSKRVHLVLDIVEAPGRLEFADRCGRSFKRYEGRWLLRDAGDRTMLTYELLAEPAFDVPEFILKRLLRRDAGEMIAELRREIARR